MTTEHVQVEHEEIFLGTFVKPFGIRGELKFVASDDFWAAALGSGALAMQRLVDGRVERRDVAVQNWRPHGANFVVKLEHVVDRTMAEEATGGELFISADDLDVELPDTYLPFQIIGATVVEEDGTVIGPVKSVFYSAAHPTYEVLRDNEIVMIPAVDEFIVNHDIDAGKIVVRLIPGLIDD